MNTEINFQKEQKKKKSNLRIIVIILLIIFCSSFFGAIFGFMAGNIGKFVIPEINLKNLLGKKTSNLNNFNEDNKEAPQLGREKIIEEDTTIVKMIEESSPSVVSIIVSKDIPKIRNFFNNPWEDFDFFFNPFYERDYPSQPKTEKRKIGGGTGFFINSNGMIVTNRHVVEDNQAEYTVVLNNGKEYAAKVLALDPVKDFAIIKIEGSGFPVLQMGDSDTLKVGQTVVAIGNSLGEFSNSVSKGIISGLKRNVVASSIFGESERLKDIIQTDAAINPGNSGGPLLDISGKVIGINVAVVQGAQNIGFAIPINQVKKTIDQVITKGKISVPFLGVRYVAINKEMQKKNNLPFDYGVLIIRGESISDLAVIPGSPADKAGIAENDIILEINGTKIDEKNDLAELIAKYNIGDTIEITVWKKGEIKKIKATLAEKN